MELSEGIRRIGFRRWYERQLIESHLYLVSCLLCLLLVLACLEGLSLRLPAWEILMRLVAIMAGGPVCVWALHRYLGMLSFAVRAAEHSVCGKCGVYSAIELSGPRARGSVVESNENEPPAVGVRCRKCGNEWEIK